jgi:cytoskeleton protein RodZ
MSELNERDVSSLMVFEEADVEESDISVTPSLGKQMFARRQAEGWSIEEVAAQLKLAPRQIVAMETDRLDTLPGATVARGFVRIYARLLGMDPVPLLSTLTAADTHSQIDSIRQQRSLSRPFTETHLPSMHTRRASRWGVIILLVIGVGLGILVAQQMNWLSLPTSLLAVFGQKQAQDSSSASTLTPVSVPVMPVRADNDVPSSEDGSSVGNSRPESLVDGSQSEPPASETQTPVVVPEIREDKPPAADSGQLTLALHQDSWIEIRRKNGSAIMSRLAKAGTTENIQIDEPVTLIVGNVSGVEARLRDVPLDLKSGTSTNVARINLK